MTKQTARVDSARLVEASQGTLLLCYLAFADAFGRHLLVDSLARCEGATIIGAADSQATMQRDVTVMRPDVVFIDANLFTDVHHGSMRGHAARPYQLVVVSARASDASGAYTSGATDFLQQPYTRARVAAVLAHVRTRAEEQALAAWARTTAAQSTPPESSVHPGPHLVRGSVTQETLTLASRGRVERVPLDAVEAVVSAGRTATVHTPSGTIQTTTPLLDIERLLDPDRFLRIHRKTVVNISCVRCLQAGAGGACVVLRSGSMLPVAKRRLAAVRRALLLSAAQAVER